MRTLILSTPRNPGGLWVTLAMALAVSLAASASRADVVGVADAPAAIVETGIETGNWEFGGAPAQAGRGAKTSAFRPAASLTANDRPATASPLYAGAGSVRVDLKCWQYGVLILHETRLVAAAEPFPYAVKFPSPSAGGVPTYLADARNATCLIKPATGESEVTPRRR